MSDTTSLAQALAKLDEAMRPSLGGSADPARRRVAQRLAQLARCEDSDLPEFAKRHMPGRTVEESGLRVARDLLLAIGGIADMEEGAPDAWAALAEVKRLLERRLAEVKAAALKGKAEAEGAASGKAERGAGVVDDAAPQPGTMAQPGTMVPGSVARPRPWGDVWSTPSHLVPLGTPSRPPEPLAGVLHAQDAPPPPSWRGGPDAQYLSPGPEAQHLPPGESPFQASNQVAPPMRPGGALGTTAVAPVAPPQHPLPFQPTTSAAVPAAVPAAAPAAAQKPGHAEGSAAPKDFNPKKTIVVGELSPIRPVLPFSSPGSPSAQGPRPGVSEPPRLDPRPPVDQNPNEITGAVQAPAASMMPFRPSAEGRGAMPSPPSVEPTPRASVAEQPLNALSLAQYASLCAELAVFPEKTEGIFWRYGLGADEKRSAVDAAWKERLRHEPAAYDAWQELYRRYHAHWTKQR